MSSLCTSTLAINTCTKKTLGLGHIINLISIDLDLVVGVPGSIFDLVLIPFEVTFTLYLRHTSVSYAFTAGVVILLIMLPLQTFLGNKIQIITKNMLKHRDERVGVFGRSFGH